MSKEPPSNTRIESRKIADSQENGDEQQKHFTKIKKFGSIDKIY